MGIMTTISVIIIAKIFITIIGFGAQGRSELYHILRSKLQTLSNRTPDAQPAIAMDGGAADRNHSGEGQGGTHTTGNHRGEGGYHGVGGGEGGPSSAAPYIYIYTYIYIYYIYNIYWAFKYPGRKKVYRPLFHSGSL